MADLRIQRNLAIACAAVALAAALGFALNRDEGGAGYAAPEVGPPAPGLPKVSPIAEEPPAAVVPAVPEPAARRTPSETRRPGSRWTAAEPAGDPVADAEEAVQQPSRWREREVVTLTVPDGTEIHLALTAPVSSQTAAVGDLVQAELVEAVAVGGRVALPAGATVVGRVTEAQALHRVGGRARLALAFESIEVDGDDVPIAAYFAREGRSETGKDAATIVAGAAIGTILGNQAKKNDRGKVIGGVIGAAAGTAVAAKTAGERIELPAGTELRLTLRESVIVSR
jgi:hypothetical protein